MKKNKIIIIIAITFLIVGIVCVCLFFSFGKNEKVDSPNKDDETKEEVEVKEGYDEFGNKLLEVYESKEEVYDVITNNYLSTGETISPAREENGCWYYMSSNGIDEYFYCIEDPIIRVKATYDIDLNELND